MRMSIMNIKLSKTKVVGLTKQQIRSKILSRLKTQKEDIRERKTKLILKKLLRQESFKKAKAVMFYIAFDGEVNTREMIKEAKRLGKIVTVPVCAKNRVTLRPAILKENAALRKGPYGVYEPQAKRCIRLEDLDLVIVPGVAFDKKGNRLGRGKGCYDRFLKRIPKETPSIGLAFDFQILPKVPAKQHDVSVNKVLFA
jgi:5-formyltetrahydrofolate cyclo-ligase